MAAIWLDLVRAAVVGAAGQLLGPVVRDVLARQSSGRRQARIAKINAEAAEMSRLRDQPSAATAYVGMLMLKTVIPSALAAILSTVKVLLPARAVGSCGRFTTLPGMPRGWESGSAGWKTPRVYRKPDHTPASYTILMFQVDDIEAAARDLATRGVRFERYDGMDQDERGITRGSDFPFIAAWFKDPAETSSRCCRSGSASSA